MIASRARAAALVLAVAGPWAAQAPAAEVASASQQMAQAADGPVQLGPRRTVAPEPAAPPQSAPAEPAVTAPTSPSGGSGPVEIQTLKAVDSDSVGLLDEQDGGLGADMWSGADRAFVARALALLPRRVGSPTMRDLMRRLLLTRAMAPPRTENAPGLLPMRIDALFAIGDLESAMALIAGAPIGPVSERLLRLEVESRFFRHDTSGACGQVRGAAQDYRDVYWQQATAYCLALAGQAAEAAFLSDILAERAQSVHPAFFAAMDRMSGAPPSTVESLDSPSALSLSMMRTASLALPADVLAQAAPAAQNAVALSPNAALDLRLAAAEKAAANGVLPGNVLNEIYSAVPFDAAALGSPLSQAEKVWGSHGRALLMRAASGHQVQAARAEVLQHAFKLARTKGGYRVTAVASRPILDGIEPSVDLAWFAGAAARALVTTGDFDTARRWIELGLSAAGASGGRSSVADGLWPLGVLAGADGTGEATAPALDAWWRARQAAGGGDPRDDARILFGLLDAIDIAVPTALWAPVVDAPHRKDTILPGSGLRITLDRAAAAQRRGETTALALAALGNTGPSGDNLMAVDMAVRALRTVGLETEARRIALEAAVAAGL